MLTVEEFQNLAMAEVAQLVRASGPKVCVFIINGTRRWFMIEHARPGQTFASAYFEATSRQLVAICRMLFDHGLDTLLLPAFNPHLMARSDSYFKMMGEALPQLTDHPRFLDFYETYGVRVRFYGDYAQCLAGTPYTHLVDQFDQMAERTRAYNERRLFLGVCAHDATDTLAELAIRYYEEHGRPPDKRALVEMYYGEYVPPANLFISSGKLHASDMPLVSSGREQLYFTVAPAFYLDQAQLRAILYDYLFARSTRRAGYEAMQAEDWATLGRFYRANQGKTLGVGARQRAWGMWYPLPQVILPVGFETE